jgi:hypothetical protein
MNDKTVFNEVYKERFGRTICEVHREMYDIMYDNLRLHPKYEELTTKLDEAYQMAKKMDAKLRQYKNNYDAGWWEKEREEVIRQKLSDRKNRI